MLKDVNLIMNKSGKKVSAKLLNISESSNSSKSGVLYDVKLDLEKRNEMRSHRLVFDLTDGEKTVKNCKIFNIDDKYMKFISH
ncbi:hypothetical protein ALNOE001_01800 [Candidatus Methanobinarius endosymbioticus]|uniref:Uncharacterized protein n=1 Tax=Candidatus Methanobinarius endosymbioticus TaxID=2006182 RepID=A0A366ME29_9EURY|nr:hypothetical protein ALNOE001_01800 [Candidatus Methanobinarius endosymbioticus]